MTEVPFMMFGSTGPRPEKTAYWELVNGEPITPRHERPSLIGDKDPPLEESVRLLFEDFADFGDVLNRWFIDNVSRWRVQELPVTELSIGFHDIPSFGRRYEVFSGPIKLGLLEISASYPYDINQKNVCACVELMWARLLRWDVLMDLLGSVAVHINSPNTSSVDRIQSAMIRSLWDSLHIADQDSGLDWGNLAITLQGTAAFYFIRRNREAFPSSYQVGNIEP